MSTCCWVSRVTRDGSWFDTKNCASAGVLIAIGELEIPIAALEDIIRSKEIADRPADRAALPELRRLREELEDRDI
jgi:hypothetical protein